MCQLSFVCLVSGCWCLRAVRHLPRRFGFCCLRARSDSACALCLSGRATHRSPCAHRTDRPPTPTRDQCVPSSVSRRVSCRPCWGARLPRAPADSPGQWGPRARGHHSHSDRGASGARVGGAWWGVLRVCAVCVCGVCVFALQARSPSSLGWSVVCAQWLVARGLVGFARLMRVSPTKPTPNTPCANDQDTRNTHDAKR